MDYRNLHCFTPALSLPLSFCVPLHLLSVSPSASLDIPLPMSLSLSILLSLAPCLSPCDSLCRADVDTRRAMENLTEHLTLSQTQDSVSGRQFIHSLCIQSYLFLPRLLSFLLFGGTSAEIRSSDAVSLTCCGMSPFSPVAQCVSLHALMFRIKAQCAFDFLV